MTRKVDTPQEQENSVFKVISTIGIFALILLTIYFTFFLWHIFTPNDDQTFTYSKSDLGTLGDLIGGILNPVLSFVTIGLLLWSIRIQGRELNAATEQSKRSADALNQTNKIHRDNIAEQKKIAIVPILIKKLDQETTLLFGKVRERIEFSYKTRGKGNARESKEIIDQNASTLSILKLYSLKMNGKDPTSSHIFKRQEYGGKARIALNDQINHIFHIIREVALICEALKNIGSDEILYFDDVNQARMITIIIRELSELLNGQPKHDVYSVLITRLETIVDRASFTAILNEDSRHKPFTIS